ncbi:hypothetical protein IID24_04875 [Patescibacteria group bacterium]|nr:hypothetical protein [Patescibacteria group bacterium]
MALLVLLGASIASIIATGVVISDFEVSWRISIVVAIAGFLAGLLGTYASGNMVRMPRPTDPVTDSQATALIVVMIILVALGALIGSLLPLESFDRGVETTRSFMILLLAFMGWISSLAVGPLVVRLIEEEARASKTRRS